MHLYLYTDGASRGNPGPSAIGIVIKNERQENLREISRYIGQGTNNNAEYFAVLIAVKEAYKLRAENVTLFVDSELVARQLSGTYKVKNKLLLQYFKGIANIIREFKAFEVTRIERKNNSEADKLANRALDNIRLI